MRWVCKNCGDLTIKDINEKEECLDCRSKVNYISRYCDGLIRVGDSRIDRLEKKIESLKLDIIDYAHELDRARNERYKCQYRNENSTEQTQNEVHIKENNLTILNPMECFDRYNLTGISD